MGIAIKICYNVKTGGNNMYYLNFKDYVVIFFKSAIMTLCISPILLLPLLNCKFAIWLCNYLEIPYDFCLTMMSPGFALEVVIVLSFFEFIIGCYLVDKLKNNKFIKAIYDKIYYM